MKCDDLQGIIWVFLGDLLGKPGEGAILFEEEELEGFCRIWKDIRNLGDKESIFERPFLFT